MQTLNMLPDTTDDPIFDNLPPKELFRYSQVSTTAHHAVSSYIKRTFRLKRVLGRYFSDDDILELRRMQSTTGALISGSTALQFFDRSYYPESDLDIYVRFDCRRDIALWLEKKGYTMQPYVKNPAASLRQVLDEMVMPSVESSVYVGSFIVLEFFKKRGDTKSKIQLLMVDDCPVASILKFHSTCVMNFIAHDKAYSLYPKGTFVTRQSLVTKLGMRRFYEYQDAFEKYKTRGWDVVMRTTGGMKSDPKFPFKADLRRVGDAECWTIPILPKLDLPPDTVEGNTWSLYLYQGTISALGFTVVATPHGRSSLTVARALLPHLRDKLSKNSPDVDQNLEDKLVAIVEQCMALHRYQLRKLGVSF